MYYVVLLLHILLLSKTNCKKLLKMCCLHYLHKKQILYKAFPLTLFSRNFFGDFLGLKTF